jgi:hypothetical protein
MSPEVSFHPDPQAAPVAAADSAEVPLRLSQAEAELLLHLCAGSPYNGGELEAALFAKLGECLREIAVRNAWARSEEWLSAGPGV